MNIYDRFLVIYTHLAAVFYGGYIYSKVSSMGETEPTNQLLAAWPFL